MENEQKSVREFHKKFGLVVNDSPTVPSTHDRIRVAKLIFEEFLEYCEAAGLVTNLTWQASFVVVSECDLVEVADALSDLAYVVKGGNVTFGIDAEPVFNEVHRSNMTKEGGAIRPDGKFIKPETYSKADIAPIILQQMLEHGSAP